MTGVTLERARDAKQQLSKMLSSLTEFGSIGIAILPAGYGVKVNFLRRPTVDIPAEIDGVPIVVDIIGDIQP